MAGNSKETEQIKQENADIKEANESLVIRIDSLVKCCGNNFTNEPGDSSDSNKNH